MRESETTSYSGSKAIDYGVAILSLLMGGGMWIPGFLTPDNLRLAAFMFFLLVFAMAVKCISNGGRLWVNRFENPRMCRECEQNYADPPSLLCPGCHAYKDHQS
jgi:hypothetical protein